MKASELIEQLTALVAEHGDADVLVPDEGCGCCSRGNNAATELDFLPAWGTANYSYPGRYYLTQ